MNIDERLERLVERHEALAQSVEMMQVSMREQDTRISRILTAIEKDAENIRGLARIAELHEHRLTDIEGGQ